MWDYLENIVVGSGGLTPESYEVIQGPKDRSNKKVEYK